LYCCANEPANSQSSGKVCIRAYSRTVKGLVSSWWQRSVCFCAGLQVKVKQGSSQPILRAIPVFPPPKKKLFCIYSFWISSGKSLQYPFGGTKSRTSFLCCGYFAPLDF